MNVESLEPKECFRWFAEIAKIPHGSHNEKRISDFLVQFAKERGLSVTRDDCLNVCIKKPASRGMDRAKPVILQGHMDMVCVKGEGVAFDFAKDPINIVINGDSVTAEGTTLGADNGVALAFILALLDAKDIPHPPLEAVITVQEEVGMAGAANFDATQLTGGYFINIDSEEEGIFCASCAGGRRARLSLPTRRMDLTSLPGFQRYAFFTLGVGGLAGGHSGLEIAKQRGNAICILGRALKALSVQFDLYAAQMSGGSAANVIPAESSALVCTTAGKADLQQVLDELAAMFRHELRASDGKGLKFTLAEAAKSDRVFSKDTLRRAIAVTMLIPNGVASMDLNITGRTLVESSNNLGMLATEEKTLVFSCLIRSSVQSRKELLYDQLAAIADMVGAEIEYFGDYPAWEFSPESELRETFLQAYKALFKKDAKVEGIHAGLECGLFFEKLKEAGRHVDFIAFGPNITGAHTTKETVSRSSAENMWHLLKEVLTRLGGK